MNDSDPLKCTFQGARRETLVQGIALSTRAKIAFFEEMVTLAVTVGAHGRLAARGTAATSR
jgi:tagatose-1,6-bisphosphate aldolase